MRNPRNEQVFVPSQNKCLFLLKSMLELCELSSELRGNIRVIGAVTVLSKKVD